MGARGRQSNASLAIVKPHGITATTRPEPPEELTPDQADVWLQVVNRMPAEWFPDETHPILAQYCRHTVQAGRLAQAIEKMNDEPEFDLREYDRLLKMHERETRAILAAGRSLRLTQQSQYSKDKKRGTLSKRPWD